MKVNNFADRKNGLDGETEDIVMSIDSDNHLTLLNSLTHLYSNPVMAAFREYCANASDAHKDSGQTKPFEVDFPFRHQGKSLHLRIRDYGKGMTKEQITKVYSQYGASTKANNNAQVGGFGLGSKSGLAVSNHLYVNTVANGVLIKAQILKNKDNQSVIRILSEEKTTAESGTEIILPVTAKQQRELFNNAEGDLVGYKPEQVLLNRKPLTYSVHNKDKFIPVTVGSNIIAYITRNDGETQNSYLYRLSQQPIKTDYSIIMGGVYYPSLPSTGSLELNTLKVQELLHALNTRLSNTPKVILNVPVGSVDLPPHRDSVIDTEKTWATLTGLLMNLKIGLDSSLQSYLNGKSLVEASYVVASMKALFSPDEVWTHKGTKYHNSMDESMPETPFLYSRFASYYGGNYNMRLDGKVSASAFTSLHLRVDSSEYNYAHSNRQKSKIAVVHLIADDDKYDEIIRWDANERAHHSVRVKMNKPRIGNLITRYLGAVIEETMQVANIYVVVTNKEAVIPAHFAGAIDVTYTENDVKAAYRKIFPPQPKKVVQQKHCRVMQNRLEHSLISSDEKIVFMGGKGCYGTEEFMGSAYLPQVVIMKKVSSGNVDTYSEFNWVQEGLLNLLDADASLVAVGDTRSPALFQKAFKEATPLGEVVMKFYDNLDDDRKEAVQHAFSIFSTWTDHTNTLFSMFGGQNFPMQNESIRLMFAEPELVSIGHYLFAFKDTYVEGLLEWKKDFVEEVKSKELAWKMLLPVQSLLEHVYFNNHVSPDGTYGTNMSVRVNKVMHIDDIVLFINKLTAN